MQEKPRAMSYARDMSVQGPTKFAKFEEMLGESKRLRATMVVVANPETLGDTYEELIRNLNKISEAELSLAIVPESERGM